MRAATSTISSSLKIRECEPQSPTQWPEPQPGGACRMDSTFGAQVSWYPDSPNQERVQLSLNSSGLSL